MFCCGASWEKDQDKDTTIKIHPGKPVILKRYKHRDTRQMCCMWSIANPPDEIYECDQIYNIEEEFNISLTEDETLSLYNMNFEEAVQFIKMKCNLI